jgi:hypothetical protein
LQWRNTSKEQLFSMYRHYLVSSFGLFAARLWARHILDHSQTEKLEWNNMYISPSGSRKPEE